MSDRFIDAGDLAERWGVSRATTLGYTRRRGFPTRIVGFDTHRPGIVPLRRPAVLVEEED